MDFLSGDMIVDGIEYRWTIGGSDSNTFNNVDVIILEKEHTIGRIVKENSIIFADSNITASVSFKTEVDAGDTD